MWGMRCGAVRCGLERYLAVIDAVFVYGILMLYL